MDSSRHIWCRCLCRGIWPVCSCIRMDVCYLGRSRVIFQKRFDGTIMSVLCSFGHLFDNSSVFFQHSLRPSLNHCLTTDLLKESCPLIALGRSYSLLDSPFAAFFASSLLLSFSFISTCPSTHRNIGGACPQWMNALSATLWMESTRYNPGVLLVSNVA